MEQQLREINIIGFSGPSSSGKSSIVAELEKNYTDLMVESVSHYTRKPREDEIDGVHYNFTDKDFFKYNKEDFIETAVFNGENCGTHISNLEKAYRSNKVLLIVLEEKGALALDKLKEIVIDGEIVSVNTTQIYLDISPVEIQETFVNQLKILQENGEGKESITGKILDFNERIKRDSETRNPEDIANVKSISKLIRTEHKNLKDIRDIVKLMPEDVQQKMQQKIPAHIKEGTPSPGDIEKAIKQLNSRGVNCYKSEDGTVVVQPVENDFLTVAISNEEINYRAEQYDIEQEEALVQTVKFKETVYEVSLPGGEKLAPIKLLELQNMIDNDGNANLTFRSINDIEHGAFGDTVLSLQEIPKKIESTLSRQNNEEILPSGKISQ